MALVLAMSLISDLQGAQDIEGLLAAVERSEGIVDRVAQLTEEKLTAVVNAEFTTETNPYGVPWADGPNYQGLIRSGAMVGSLDVRARGTEIEMSMDEPFIFHQAGTKNKDGSRRMVQRKIFPYEEELPPPYQQAVDDAFDEVVGK